MGSGTSISMSYSTGSVAGGDTATVGGLAAAANHVDQSYATGAVTAGNNGAMAGGLLGSGSGISNSYSTGAVHVGSSKNQVGGFAGMGDTMTASYSTGLVTQEGGSKLGGFIGHTRGESSSHDYWDLDTSGASQGCGRGDCSAYVGLTTEELQSGLPAGFDVKIWGENPKFNNGLPYLRALPPK